MFNCVLNEPQQIDSPNEEEQEELVDKVLKEGLRLKRKVKILQRRLAEWEAERGAEVREFQQSLANKDRELQEALSSLNSNHAVEMQQLRDIKSREIEDLHRHIHANDHALQQMQLQLSQPLTPQLSLPSSFPKSLNQSTMPLPSPSLALSQHHLEQERHRDREREREKEKKEREQQEVVDGLTRRLCELDDEIMETRKQAERDLHNAIQQHQMEMKAMSMRRDEGLDEQRTMLLRRAVIAEQEISRLQETIAQMNVVQRNSNSDDTGQEWTRKEGGREKEVEELRVMLHEALAAKDKAEQAISHTANTDGEDDGMFTRAGTGAYGSDKDLHENSPSSSSSSSSSSSLQKMVESLSEELAAAREDNASMQHTLLQQRDALCMARDEIDRLQNDIEQLVHGKEAVEIAVRKVLLDNDELKRKLQSLGNGSVSNLNSPNPLFSPCSPSSLSPSIHPSRSPTHNSSHPHPHSHSHTKVRQSSIINVHGTPTSSIHGSGNGNSNGNFSLSIPSPSNHASSFSMSPSRSQSQSQSITNKDQHQYYQPQFSSRLAPVSSPSRPTTHAHTHVRTHSLTTPRSSSLTSL